MQTCDLLVQAGLLMTLDDNGTLLTDAALAVSRGRILATGPLATMAAEWQPARRLGSDHHLVLPGLVNTHNHTPLTLVRGMVEDAGFAPAYLPNVPQGDALSEEEAYLLARLGVWELLRFGSTTVVDFYRHPAALARALQEAGLRGFVGSRIMDVDATRLGHGERRHDPALAETMLAEAATFAETWRDRDALITPVLGPHAPDTCSRALLIEVARLAEATGLGVHTHLHQSQGEVAAVLARENCRPVELMEQVGLLGPHVVAGHCIWVDAADIGRIGRSGTAVAHAPIGNLAHGSIAPALALEQAGARITLCTDTKSGDMFQAMRTALAVARVKGAGFALGASHVLRWGTRDGAQALGMPDLGMLAPGWRADLVLLDANMPNLRPLLEGPGLVVHSAVGANVDAVVVDGCVVMEDGQPTLFNAQEVVRSAQAVAERLWRRAGRRPAAPASYASA
jgi:5-methylthioadenosine/S-adenosylhomocysteine deaminase